MWAVSYIRLQALHTGVDISRLTLSQQQELTTLLIDRVALGRGGIVCIQWTSMNLRGYCLLEYRCRRLNGMHKPGTHFVKTSRKHGPLGQNQYRKGV